MKRGPKPKVDAYILRRMLALRGHGLHDSLIAQRLQISVYTVSKYLAVYDLVKQL